MLNYWEKMILYKKVLTKKRQNLKFGNKSMRIK